MSKFEILCTTMHQSDFSKIEQMNIHSDVVFANQADETSLKSVEFEGHTAKMITTKTRGLSRNRNIALCHSTADIIVFADDDLIFKNDYEQTVLNEFKNHPEADAIKFNLNCISERKISMKPITSFHKPNRLNVTSWGVCALAIKRDVLTRKNLFFDENFGSGTSNFCGEDTIFYQELLKKGIKLYASPIYIADIDLSSSTWFTGYSKKQFKISGKLLARTYPVLAYILPIRSAYKFKRRKVNFSYFEILQSYFEGIREYKKFGK